MCTHAHANTELHREKFQLANMVENSDGAKLKRSKQNRRAHRKTKHSKRNNNKYHPNRTRINVFKLALNRPESANCILWPRSTHTHTQTHNINYDFRMISVCL